MNGFLRLLLAIWAVAFPVISCGPILLGVNEGATGALVGGIAGLILGSVLFGPWIVGLILLGIGVYLTRPPAGSQRDVEGQIIVGSPESADPRRVAAGRHGSASTAGTDVPPGRFVDARLIVGLALLIGGLLVLVAVAGGSVR